MHNTFWDFALLFIMSVNTVGIELIGNYEINKPEIGACLYYMKRLRIAIVASSGAYHNI
jgi:hypothetical protein